MLPEVGVGSTVPAHWYNSEPPRQTAAEINQALARQKSFSESSVEEDLPVTNRPTTTNHSPEESQPEGDKENNHNHQEYINKLAQPRRCLATDKPARLNLKKKVVAFGKTVNYSQTIEGTSRRTFPKSSTPPAATQQHVNNNNNNNKMLNNKENEQVRNNSAKKPTVQEASTTGDKNDDRINQVLDIVRQNREKQEADMAALMKMVQNLATGSPANNNQVQSPQLDERNRFKEDRLRLLKQLERHLEMDPMFINDLNAFVKTAGNRLSRMPPSERMIANPAPSRTSRPTPPPQTAPDFNRSRSGVVTERMTLERSFMSPRADLFSVDSRRYLGDNGLFSPEHNTPQQVQDEDPVPNSNIGPRSYYQPGFSVAYYPENGPITECSEDDDFSGQVVCMNNERYERHAAAREARLAKTPFPLITEEDEKRYSPQLRKQHEAERQFEEKRRRRMESLKKN